MRTTPQLLRAIAVHLRQSHKRQLLILSFFTVLSALAELASLGSVLPFLAVLTDPERIWEMHATQNIAVFFGWTNSRQLLLPLTALFAFAAICSASIRLFNLWLSGRLAATIGSDLSKEAYRRTLLQPYSVHTQRNSSFVIDSIISQSGITISAINITLQTITSSFVALALMAGLIAINPFIAIFAFTIFSISYILIGVFARRELLENGKIIKNKRGLVLKSLQEGLGAVRDVILDGTQDAYVTAYAKADIPHRRLKARNNFLASFPRSFLEALALVLISLLSFYQANTSSNNYSILPLIGVFALGCQRLLPSLQQSYNGWSSLKAYSADIEGLLKLLEQPTPNLREHRKELHFSSSLQLKNISYSYPDSERLIIDDLSLAIPKGQRLGIIGSTGSGKTTLVNILMGLLPPRKGIIMCDKIILNDQSYPELIESWMSLVAHVPQNIFISDATVAQNVAFGVSAGQIDKNKVIRSLQKAQLYSFVNTLADGIDTVVGEQGVKLSGGQRQRIGIARAFYKNAKVLILDEATSALDHRTENDVMTCINELDRDLTLIMVAHRLSTVSDCDRVIKIENGNIVQDGIPSKVLSS